VTSAARQRRVRRDAVRIGAYVVAWWRPTGLRVGDAMVGAWAARGTAAQTFHATRPAGGSRRTRPWPGPAGPPHIHKFGGASLANAAGIAHAVKIVVAHRPGHRSWSYRR